MKKKANRFIANNMKHLADDSLIRHKIIELFSRDFKEFTSAISFIDPIAISSVPSKSNKRPDLYEGTGGYLFVLLRILQSPNSVLTEKIGISKADLLNFCKSLTKKFIPFFTSSPKEEQLPDKITFLTGETGLLILCMQVAQLENDDLKFSLLYNQLLERANLVLQKPGKYYCELLYGLPGFLYSLLCARLWFPTKKMDGLDDLLLAFYMAVIDRGRVAFRSYAKLQPSAHFRLVYDFHGTEYIGGAHGLLGILHILLQTLELILPKLSPEQLSTIHQIYKSLDFCVGLQLDSGNFPSNPKSEHEHLMQFCHGAPGATAPLLKAAQMLDILGPDFQKEFNKQRYINSAKMAGLSIWKEGILLKGFGICHGIAGNAFAMLEFVNYGFITQEEKDDWAQKAKNFMLLKFDENVMKAIESFDFEARYAVGKPDYPYSLMLGLAGDICLELDLIDGKCKYPGYDV